MGAERDAPATNKHRARELRVNEAALATVRGRANSDHAQLSLSVVVGALRQHVIAVFRRQPSSARMIVLPMRGYLDQVHPLVPGWSPRSRHAAGPYPRENALETRASRWPSRSGVESWFDAVIKTRILVPSSANGGEMVAFEEMGTHVRAYRLVVRLGAGLRQPR